MSDWINDDELKKILNLNIEDETEENGKNEMSKEEEEDFLSQLLGEEEEEEEEEEIKEEVEIKGLELEQFINTENSNGEKISGFDALFDIPMDIRVVLGSSEKRLEEILEFKIDSVIKLSKMAGELVDVFIGDQAIAKGEIVIIDDKFGILINEILPPRERVKTVENKLRKQKQ